MKKDKKNAAFNAPLLNDDANNLAIQLRQCFAKNSEQHKKIDSLFESPLEDIVTTEYIRGYN